MKKYRSQSSYIENLVEQIIDFLLLSVLFNSCNLLGFLLSKRFLFNGVKLVVPSIVFAWFLGLIFLVKSLLNQDVDVNQLPLLGCMLVQRDNSRALSFIFLELFSFSILLWLLGFWNN